MQFTEAALLFMNKCNKYLPTSLLYQRILESKFLDSDSTSFPNNLTPVPDPDPVLAKVLNSNSFFTPVQLSGMAC